MDNNGEEMGESLMLLFPSFGMKLGISVAQNHRALDRNSMKARIEIEEENALRKYDIKVMWDHIPRVDLAHERSLTVKIEEGRNSKNRLGVTCLSTPLLMPRITLFTVTMFRAQAASKQE